VGLPIMWGVRRGGVGWGGGGVCEEGRRGGGGREGGVPGCLHTALGGQGSAQARWLEL
jgi:hypothetical protein